MGMLKAFFEGQGEKLSLGAALFVFLAVLVCAGFFVPDMEGEVATLGKASLSIKQAFDRDFTGKPDVVPIGPAAVTSPVAQYDFPSDLHQFILPVGAVTVDRVEFRETETVEKDYANLMQAFDIGRIHVCDKGGQETQIVRVERLGGARVRFSSAPLSSKEDWTGSFTISRKGLDTLAVSGEIRVRKVHEKPKLLGLPGLEQVEEVDPVADLGRIRISWTAAKVAPAPMTPIRYLVERCEGVVAGDRFMVVTKTPVEGISYEDADAEIAPGKTYHYRVRALLPRDVVIPPSQPSPSPLPPWDEQGIVTEPTSHRSIDMPAPLMFRCEAVQGGERPRALFTIWIWDASKRAWDICKHVRIEVQEEIGRYSDKDKKVLIQGTGLKVVSILLGEGGGVRVAATASGGKVDKLLAVGTAYRIMRLPIMRSKDLQPYEGLLMKEAEGVNAPGPQKEPTGDPDQEAEWEDELKRIQTGLDEVNKFLSVKKWSEADSAIKARMGEVDAAEQKMQGKFLKRAQVFKQRLGDSRKKVEEGLKKDEKELEKIKEQSGLK